MSRNVSQKNKIEPEHAYGHELHYKHI